jgi:pimeloyl-ACP methyl ester carboxylesterase
MPRVDTGQVQLHYERFGEGEPIVLIMGLGAQMVMWDEDFCRRLADAGFSVIRFDNRDAGESTHLDHLGIPPVGRQIMRWSLGLPVQSHYTLHDMAADVRGLLDGLGIDAAHVVGASMGGMIAQQLAIDTPDRVRSLTSIMSHPGDRLSGIPRPNALAALFLRPPPKTAKQAEEHVVNLFATVGGRAVVGDEDMLRRQARRTFERGVSPAGFARQLGALLTAKDRRRALARVRKPSLVVHGSEDPLVRPRGGEQTARSLPEGEFLLLDGMGHHVASRHWDRIIDAITRTAGRA